MRDIRTLHGALGAVPERVVNVLGRMGFPDWKCTTVV